MKKLINCKNCGAQMAQDAKVCPQCGAKNKLPAWAVVAITVVIIVFVTYLIGSLSNQPTNENVPANNSIDTSANTSNENNSLPESQPESQIEETSANETPSSALIGESYKCGDWTICVNSIEFTKRYEYSEYFYHEAEEGQQYLRMNLSVTNNGTGDSEFLPYFGGGVSAKLIYKDDYTYTLVSSYFEDELYGKSIPALATQTGYIQFNVPDEVAEDAANAKVIFKSGNGKDSVTYMLG